MAAFAPADPHTPENNLSAATSAAADRQQAPYLLFILLVSVFALAVLAAEVFVDERSETGRILHYADTLLCVLFFGDFLICLKRAKNKVRYMLTWGWLDLLSSIPAIDVLRWGRAGRMVRVLRVLRGIRSARILMRFILERRAQSAALAATLVSIVVIALASIVVLELEGTAGEAANIRTAQDAMWWSMVTITTVGYGDHYPVTVEGRMVAAFLMAVGVGLIGTWSGIAASWFLMPGETRRDEDLIALGEEVRLLRERLEKHNPTDAPTDGAVFSKIQGP